MAPQDAGHGHAAGDVADELSGLDPSQARYYTLGGTPPEAVLPGPELLELWRTKAGLAPEAGDAWYCDQRVEDAEDGYSDAMEEYGRLAATGRKTPGGIVAKRTKWDDMIAAAYAKAADQKAKETAWRELRSAAESKGTDATPPIEEPAEPEAGKRLNVYEVEIPKFEPRYVLARTIVDAEKFMRATLAEPKIVGMKITGIESAPSNRIPARTAYEDVDYTAEREKGGWRAEIGDWRTRKAKTPVPDDAPQWGRWSEFWVYLDVPGIKGKVPINVIHDGRITEHFRSWHIEFRGAVSSTGYRSHFMSDTDVARAKEVGIVQYALEAASAFNAEERKGKGLNRKPKKPKAPPMPPEAKAAVVETLRELGVHDCQGKPDAPKPPKRPSLADAVKGLPREEPRWDVPGRFEVSVRSDVPGHKPTLAVFTFEIQASTRFNVVPVSVGRPAFLGFDPAVATEHVNPSTQAKTSPREWGERTAEGMMRGMLVAPYHWGVVPKGKSTPTYIIVAKSEEDAAAKMASTHPKGYDGSLRPATFAELDSEDVYTVPGKDVTTLVCAGCGEERFPSSGPECPDCGSFEYRLG